jgi:hypothetical protein
MNEEMSQEGKAVLDKFNSGRTDWWAICSECNQRVSGTLAEIAKHAKEHKDAQQTAP